MEDNKQPTTPEDEDVEGHALAGLPPNERPPMEATTEEPDVEAHALPPNERPPAEAYTEKPVDM